MISSCTFPAWIRPLNSIPKLRSGELRNSPLLPWVICSKGRSKERNTTEATGLYWHLIRKSGPTVLSRQGCVRMKTWLTDGLGLMRGLILGPSITRPSFLKLIFSPTAFLTMWHSPTFKCANIVHGEFIQGMFWRRCLASHITRLCMTIDRMNSHVEKCLVNFHWRVNYRRSGDLPPAEPTTQKVHG